MIPSSSIKRRAQEKSPIKVEDNSRIDDDHNDADTDTDEGDDEFEESEVFPENEYRFLREKIGTLYELQKANNATPEKQDNHTGNYVYQGLTILKQDLDDYFDAVDQSKQNRTVHICGFHVNDQHKYPFLEYFLYKAVEGDGVLGFPSFEYVNSVNALAKSILVMESFAKVYSKQGEQCFKGYLNDDANMYIFYDCSSLRLDGFKMQRVNDVWVVTIDEIVNHRKLCDFAINPFVTDFFINRPALLQLSDSDGISYQTPSVVYYGTSRDKLDFTAHFGVPSSGSGGFMGDHFYFTDFQNAVQLTGWWDDDDFGDSARRNGVGIIRCALFTGKMKVAMTVDELDDDDEWTLRHDTIYVGRIATADGTPFEDYPLWVSKSYDSQVVLSSHVIQTRNMGEKWSREAVYTTF
jgi:hypothetical protein